jgi:hypothetical protein
LWKSQPEDSDKLEGVVECYGRISIKLLDTPQKKLTEPVNSTDCALKHGQESINNPISQPLGIVGSSMREQSIERVICWEDESDGVYKEFSSNVEKHKEEVESSKAEYYINLGNTGLRFKVIKDLVFAELERDGVSRRPDESECDSIISS